MRVKEKRYWVVDLFSKAVYRPANVADEAEAIARVNDPLTKKHKASDILKIERDPNKPTRLLLLFRGSAEHPHDLTLSSPAARQRMYELLRALRLETVWCPYLHRFGDKVGGGDEDSDEQRQLQQQPRFVCLQGKTSVPYLGVDEWTESCSDVVDEALEDAAASRPFLTHDASAPLPSPGAALPVTAAQLPPPHPTAKPTHMVSGRAKVKVSAQGHLPGSIYTASLNMGCLSSEALRHAEVDSLLFGKGSGGAVAPPPDADLVVVCLTNTVSYSAAAAAAAAAGPHAQAPPFVSYTQVLRTKLRALGFGLVMSTEEVPPEGLGGGDEEDEDVFASGAFAGRRGSRISEGGDGGGGADGRARGPSVRGADAGGGVRARLKSGLGRMKKQAERKVRGAATAERPGTLSPTPVLALFARRTAASYLTNSSIWTGCHTKTFSEQRVMGVKKDVALHTNMVTFSFTYRETSLCFVATCLQHVNDRTKEVLGQLAECADGDASASRIDEQMTMLYEMPAGTTGAPQALRSGVGGGARRAAPDLTCSHQSEYAVAERAEVLRLLLKKAETGYADGDLLVKFDHTVLMGGVGHGYGSATAHHATPATWDGLTLSALGKGSDRLSQDIAARTMLAGFEEGDLRLSPTLQAKSLDNRVLYFRGREERGSGGGGGGGAGAPGGGKGGGSVHRMYASAYEACAVSVDGAESGGRSGGTVLQGVRALLSFQARLLYCEALSGPRSAKCVHVERLRVRLASRREEAAAAAAPHGFFSSAGAAGGERAPPAAHLPPLGSKHFVSVWAPFADAPALRSTELRVEEGFQGLQCGGLTGITPLTHGEAFLSSQELVLTLKEMSSKGVLSGVESLMGGGGAHDPSPYKDASQDGGGSGGGPGGDGRGESSAASVVGSCVVPLEAAVELLGRGSGGSVFFRQKLHRASAEVTGLPFAANSGLREKLRKAAAKVPGGASSSASLFGDVGGEGAGTVLVVEGVLRVTEDTAVCARAREEIALRYRSALRGLEADEASQRTRAAHDEETLRQPLLAAHRRLLQRARAVADALLQGAVQASGALLRSDAPRRAAVEAEHAAALDALRAQEARERAVAGFRTAAAAVVAEEAR
eukprot:Rhum_TRINITY_DN14269_c18_g1::Rhum_TRINITY_DN14269_c18_g1_i1::g.78603::m.78603